MKILKLVLENCVFSFQGNFFKQLHGAAMGSLCSPVVANIYMEYFKDMALGPELPLPIKEWKRYMDDVFSIIPKGQCDTMLQYLNSIKKKDIVYLWECQADGCSSSYVGESSRSLGERVKEHSKLNTSAILKHCTDFHHPLPSIENFSIIDKDSSQFILDHQMCQVPLHYINQPSSGQSSSLLIKTSCLRLKLVELTSL